MSRANPIALRIASKTQSSMFIGVSQYYFYDHLKQNLNIFKLTGLVNKQLVLPTNKLLKYKANSDNLTVLTPHLLPINTTCAAKQLFSTTYRLNKRRFSSAILHYICWLQDSLNTNFKRFNTGTGFVKYDKPYKFENLSIAPINLDGRQSNVKKNYTQFCYITKANQISGLYKYFVFNRSNNNNLPYKLEPSENFINCLIRLSSLTLKRGVRPCISFAAQIAIKAKARKLKVTKRAKLDMRIKEITLFNSKVLYTQHFKKMQIEADNHLGQLIGSHVLTENSYSPVLQKIHDFCCFRPNYKGITNNMLLLAFLNVFYSQNNTIYNNSFAKRIIKTEHQNVKQQKSLLSTEKSTQFTSLNNSIDSTVRNNLSIKYRYMLSPYSGLKKSNYSNFSKVQKHINFFSNTTKPIVPLELIIYRSFCEPAGLNYFTALDNRLSKSRFNINFSNILFRRTSNSGFIPNYTNTHTGLIRLKAQIIFEFLYTLNNQSKSDIEQNHRDMLDSEKTKLWLRKGSSIRL